MTSREWRDVWTFGPDAYGARARLTELVQDGAPVPGALILTVTDGDGSKGWASLDFASLAGLREALDRWGEPLTEGHSDRGRC